MASLSAQHVRAVQAMLAQAGDGLDDNMQTHGREVLKVALRMAVESPEFMHALQRETPGAGQTLLQAEELLGSLKHGAGHAPHGGVMVGRRLPASPRFRSTARGGQSRETAIDLRETGQGLCFQPVYAGQEEEGGTLERDHRRVRPKSGGTPVSGSESDALIENNCSGGSAGREDTNGYRQPRFVVPSSWRTTSIADSILDTRPKMAFRSTTHTGRTGRANLRMEQSAQAIGWVPGWEDETARRGGDDCAVGWGGLSAGERAANGEELGRFTRSGVRAERLAVGRAKGSGRARVKPPSSHIAGGGEASLGGACGAAQAPEAAGMGGQATKQQSARGRTQAPAESERWTHRPRRNVVTGEGVDPASMESCAPERNAGNKFQPSSSAVAPWDHSKPVHEPRSTKRLDGRGNAAPMMTSRCAHFSCCTCR